MDHWGVVTTGLWLASASPASDSLVLEYGLAGLITMFVLRETFGVLRYVVERRRNGGRSDHDVLIKLQAHFEALRDRVDRLEE